MQHTKLYTISYTKIGTVHTHIHMYKCTQRLRGLHQNNTSGYSQLGDLVPTFQVEISKQNDRTPIQKCLI
jgi:hypothetical protein